MVADVDVHVGTGPEDRPQSHALLQYSFLLQLGVQVEVFEEEDNWFCLEGVDD